MFLYVGSNKLEELRRCYYKIAPLFPLKEQTEMRRFLDEIEATGKCQIEDYNNIYSLLNRVYEAYSLEVIDNNKTNQSALNINEDDLTNLIDLLNTIRLQFATFYYFSTNECDSFVLENSLTSKPIGNNKHE